MYYSDIVSSFLASIVCQLNIKSHSLMTQTHRENLLGLVAYSPEESYYHMPLLTCLCLKGFFTFIHVQVELYSFSVYLDQGRIEVRVRAGDRQRTLTSSETYNNGGLHVVRVELGGSSRLVLRTKGEVVGKRLQTVPADSLATYSELLVGGVGEGVREREGVDQSNFTGCISVYSLSSLPKVPQCFEGEMINCSFCSSHEVGTTRTMLIIWNTAKPPIK